jgi:hypothetical protein
MKCNSVLLPINFYFYKDTNNVVKKCVLLFKLPLTLKTSIYSFHGACCKFERLCWSVPATSCSVLCLWPTMSLGLCMQPLYLRILYRKKSGGLGSRDHGGQGHS